MNRSEIEALVKKQNAFFSSNQTKDVKFRLSCLKRLYKEIKQAERSVINALKQDLCKSEYESYMTEIGMVYQEIKHMKRNLKKYAKKKKVKMPISQFPSKGYRIPSPYGTVLIVSPWNYPFNLTMVPLVDAIAAGNTVIVKPSNYSSNTTSVIELILSRAFSSEHVKVVTGGKEAVNDLLAQKFDYIFYTGGKAVGQKIMEEASKTLTPVTLELGGKSPCIVCDDANIDVAAARIVFGKCINAGQTCVAPDYLIVDSKIKDKLVEALKKEIVKQYGINPIENYNYGKIINDYHFDRLVDLLHDGHIIFGGENNQKNKISPTLIDKVSLESSLMQEEIFGPILPIFTYKRLEEIVAIVKKNPTPLSLYLFTNDKAIEKMIMDNINFGGGCINDTISHVAALNLPFGGIGTSGIGAYHGKAGFDTFSHYKSILKKKNWLDINLRYQPYNDKKLKKVKRFLK